MNDSTDDVWLQYDQAVLTRAVFAERVKQARDNYKRAQEELEVLLRAESEAVDSVMRARAALKIKPAEAKAKASDGK